MPELRTIAAEALAQAHALDDLAELCAEVAAGAPGTEVADYLDCDRRRLRREAERCRQLGREAYRAAELLDVAEQEAAWAAVSETLSDLAAHVVRVDGPHEIPGPTERDR